LKGEKMTNAIQTGAKQVSNFVTKNSSTILTGFSVAGLLTTVGLAIRATPKAVEILRREELEREMYSDPPPITKMEAIKLVWKCYIPSAAVGLATILCIIGSNTISTKRNAALASLYSLTEKAMQEYQAKVVEVIGKNKEEKIKDEVIKDTIDRNPVTKNVVIMTNKGDTLCYDILSGRYFKSDMEHIRKVENDFNHDLMQEMYRTLNEWYDALGLEGTKTGRNTGWTTENGMLEILFSAKMTDDGQPCMVLDYRNGPVMVN